MQPQNDAQNMSCRGMMVHLSFCKVDQAMVIHLELRLGAIQPQL
jgi:hypothetical protein